MNALLELSFLNETARIVLRLADNMEYEYCLALTNSFITIIFCL